MSTMLAELAVNVGVSERTLRRAWSLGTIRGERPTPHTLRVPIEERLYIRRRWSTLSRLRQALRTEPAVSLAVVFGSVARGDDIQGSDVDLLVALRSDDLRARVMLADRLRRRTDLAVETISLTDALAHPSLMVEILRDGRVLVDRDERWAQLRSEAQHIRERSEQDRRLRAARAREAAVVFQRRAEAGT
jgi:predicted nucleotidyltransferase